jgi:hypothetical protein
MVVYLITARSILEYKFSRNNDVYMSPGPESSVPVSCGQRQVKEPLLVLTGVDRHAYVIF